MENSGQIFDGINLRKLGYLLADPEPGLFVWNEAMRAALAPARNAALEDAISAIELLYSDPNADAAACIRAVRALKT